MYRAGGAHPRIAVGQDALSETKRHESTPEKELIGNMIEGFSLRCGGSKVFAHLFILRRCHGRSEGRPHCPPCNKTE